MGRAMHSSILPTDVNTTASFCSSYCLLLYLSCVQRPLVIQYSRYRNKMCRFDVRFTMLNSPSVICCTIFASLVSMKPNWSSILFSLFTKFTLTTCSAGFCSW
uniref:Uncharacterized protein n=1 Tax=Cacopsylla melanoneura TaxID=428564 RepID=A0A8D8ZDE4_9HEMI